MHTESISKWQHAHVFGQDQIRLGERRSLIVILMTGIMMIGEITAGIIFGSMALTADGIHMGSHMAGLGITFYAYLYARKHAQDQRYSFGTGKVNALAGYSSALILIFIALFMAYESIIRIINPVEIHYNQAILVAFIGLVVNGVSMVILGDKGHTHRDEEHTLQMDDHQKHGQDKHAAHDHASRSVDEPVYVPSGSGDDHNLKAAYLHVFTDAITSVLAIFALLTAKYLDIVWMDPIMGIVGAILVIRWSTGLIQGATKVLLDHQSPSEIRDRIIKRWKVIKTRKCQICIFGASDLGFILPRCLW